RSGVSRRLARSRRLAIDRRRVDRRIVREVVAGDAGHCRGRRHAALRARATTPHSPHALTPPPAPPPRAAPRAATLPAFPTPPTLAALASLPALPAVRGAAIGE